MCFKRVNCVWTVGCCFWTVQLWEILARKKISCKWIIHASMKCNRNTLLSSLPAILLELLTNSIFPTPCFFLTLRWGLERDDPWDPFQMKPFCDWCLPLQLLSEFVGKFWKEWCTSLMKQMLDRFILWRIFWD